MKDLRIGYGRLRGKTSISNRKFRHITLQERAQNNLLLKRLVETKLPDTILSWYYYRFVESAKVISVKDVEKLADLCKFSRKWIDNTVRSFKNSGKYVEE